jgi:hypothetical protein
MTRDCNPNRKLPRTKTSHRTHRRARQSTALVGVLIIGVAAVTVIGPRVSAFAASMGISRSTTESLFHSIDGGHTVFKSAAPVKGVPRVLGGDKRLFTVVEVNGSPEVIDVQIVTILDTSSKSVLENQVIYDSLVCRVFANVAAEKWCTGRILNTNAKGINTATKTKSFQGLNMTVKTYLSKKGSGPPIVALNFSPL